MFLQRYIYALIVSLLLVVSSAGARADHTAATENFSSLLAKHVSDGVVDYAGIQSDVAELDQYIDFVAGYTEIAQASLEEKLVFYVNAYNALAIKGILNGRSPSSLVGKVGFFFKAKYVVAGEKINLNDLEHKVLRKLGEPRIHFALVCASISCPKLRSEAYRVSDVYAQMDENTRDFVNDTSKNSFDTKKNKASLSKIFKWFKEDFQRGDEGVQSFISKYLEDSNVASVLAQQSMKVSYKKYNWKLNGSK